MNLLTILLHSLHLYIAIAEGPYHFVAEEPLECEGVDYEPLFVVEGMKLYKYNRTALGINCTLILKIPLDDSLSWRLRLDKWGNGGWKKDAIAFEREGVCTSLQDYTPEFLKILGDSKVLPRCPIPIGTYRFTNFLAHEFETSRGLPVFEYGKYKIWFEMYNTEQTLGCIGLMGLVKAPPHKNKKKG